MVTRPRALPLLTPFETSQGVKHIWTTFSEDQIVLNFQNPKVLLDILDILLMYAQNGARLIRLDAIGYAWKKLGIIRRINREKLNKEQLDDELKANSIRKQIFHRFSELIKIRRGQSAFHPQAKQDVLFLDDRVFSIVRTNEATDERILVLANLSDEIVHLSQQNHGVDLISEGPIPRSLLRQVA